MVPCRHHVREREQRRHQRVVLADRQDHERAVGLRHAYRFALAAVDSVGAVPASVQARDLQPVSAEHARAVRPDEWGDDEVACLDRVDVGADVLGDADELVAHPAAAFGRLHVSVRPEVAAANRRVGYADERIGRLDDLRVRDVLDADISGSVHQRGAHVSFLPQAPLRTPRR